MAEQFEAMLTGGHPNSLGRIVEVVDAVLADRARLARLYTCYFSEDEVVRLRVSSVNNSMQVLREWSLDDPALADWLLPHLERLTHDPRKSVAARATKLLAKSKQV